MRMPWQEDRIGLHNNTKKTRRANPQQTHSVVASNTVENDTDASTYTCLMYQVPHLSHMLSQCTSMGLSYRWRLTREPH